MNWLRPSRFLPNPLTTTIDGRAHDSAWAIRCHRHRIGTQRVDRRGYLAEPESIALVLERRDIIGGAAVTEDIPRLSAFHLLLCMQSTAAGSGRGSAAQKIRLSRSPIRSDLFVPYPMATTSWRSSMANAPASRSPAIQKKMPRRMTNTGNMGSHSGSHATTVAPACAHRSGARCCLFRSTGASRPGNAHRTSVGDLLDSYFESDKVKAPYATGGVIGVNAGPYDPGTAYVKFHHLIGSIDGHQGAWGFVRGGMGSITQALDSYCRGRRRH